MQIFIIHFLPFNEMQNHDSVAMEDYGSFENPSSNILSHYENHNYIYDFSFYLTFT